jgi:phosphatidylglycerophosphate synthase
VSVSAVIYLSDAASLQWAHSAVAGRSVLARMIMTAVRAGVKEIGLPPSLSHESVLRQIPRSRELARVTFSRSDRLLGSNPLLFLPAHGVVDPGSLSKLREAGQRGTPAALEQSKGSPAPVVVMAGEQAQSLRDRLAADARIGEELDSRVRSGKLTLVAADGYFVPVTDTRSQREAEAALYQSLGTEADSLVDRLINRPSSRLLTRLLVKLRVTPNTVTLASLALGLAAAAQFWMATPASALLGFILYMLSVIGDHCDGDIARLTFQESALGRWLDILADTTTHALLVLAMGATASVGGGAPFLLAGGLAAFGVVMSALFANFLPYRPREARRFGRVLVRLGNRDTFYLVLIAFVLAAWKIQWALPSLLWVLALGSQAYWVSYLVQRRLGAR